MLVFILLVLSLPIQKDDQKSTCGFWCKFGIVSAAAGVVGSGLYITKGSTSLSETVSSLTKASSVESLDKFGHYEPHSKEIGILARKAWEEALLPAPLKSHPLADLMTTPKPVNNGVEYGIELDLLKSARVLGKIIRIGKAVALGIGTAILASKISQWKSNRIMTANKLTRMAGIEARTGIPQRRGPIPLLNSQGITKEEIELLTREVVQ